jgi:hypothetical protein
MDSLDSASKANLQAAVLIRFNSKHRGLHAMWLSRRPVFILTIHGAVAMAMEETSNISNTIASVAFPVAPPDQELLGA